ncbi:MAG TPA: cytochrome P450 [Kofleriaceae bacterium]|nr:cytochrome P450 [Kofleriaceae bacterium]
MSPLPPGPRSTLLHSLRYARDPFGSSLRCFEEYGDPFTAPTVFGPQVITADPEVVEAVFAADPATFAATGAAQLGPVMGQSSVMLQDGERHRAARKLLAPPFHRAAIERLGEAIADVARHRIGALPRGRAFDIHDVMREITSDVIVRIVFGATEARAARALTAQLYDVASTLKPTFLLVPALRRRLGGLSAWARFQRACERSQVLVGELIAARRDAPPGPDLLGILLGARDAAGEPLSEREVWEQLMTFFMAGHDTTASALAWAVQLVHRDPQVRDRLRAEVAGVAGATDAAALAALPYLEAVCLETLRLCPIAPYIARDLRRPFPVGGYELPAGATIAISIIGIHRRPELYPDPARFDPERFLGKSYPPSQFLPFGGGARRCLGAALAMLEMKLVLGVVMQAPPLRLIGDPAIRAAVRNTTVGPRGGVRVELAAA